MWVFFVMIKKLIIFSYSNFFKKGREVGKLFLGGGIILVLHLFYFILKFVSGVWRMSMEEAESKGR